MVSIMSQTITVNTNATFDKSLNRRLISDSPAASNFAQLFQKQNCFRTRAIVRHDVDWNM